MRYKEIQTLYEVVNKSVTTASIDMYKKEAEKYLLEPAFDTVVGNTNGYDIRYFKTNSLIYLGATKDDQLVSYLLVNPRLYKYPAIDLTWTSPNHRGNGIMKYLVKYWVDHYGPVLSDYEQSDSAQGMWKSLFKNPNGLKIKVYNTSTNEISDVNDPDNDWSMDPWNSNTHDVHFMAEKKTKRKKKSLLVPLIIGENGGRIVKGVNTTVDVGMDEITKQAAKFGNKVTRDGRPPIIGEAALDELKLSGHEPEGGVVTDLTKDIKDFLDKDSKVVDKISGFDLRQAKGYSSETNYGLYDGKDMIASLLLNMSTKEYPAIAVTWTAPQYRGKGLMKSMFAYLVQKYGAILSDGSQSDQAQGMWKSMIKNPPHGTQVLVWNEKLHQSSELGDYYNDWSMDPWDGNPDTCLMLSKS